MKCEDRYYIDKTQSLEKGIEIFPSVYIEGAAASGKTMAVKMLLAKHPEVSPLYFFMEEESRCTEKFLQKLEAEYPLMENRKTWLIFENMPEELPQGIAAELVRLAEKLPQECRMIFVGRERPEAEFLKLLWKRKMELLSQKEFCFTKEEIRQLTEAQGSPLSAEEVYRETGGWAGCVDLMLRLSLKEQKSGIQRTAVELRRYYEINTYIEKEIMESLSVAEQEIMHYAAVSPWLSEAVCRDVCGISTAKETLERLERKGLLISESGRWKSAALFRKNAEEILSRKEDSLTNRFFRAVYYYVQRDFQRLGEEIQKLDPKAGKNEREIFLNLSYLNPELPLDEWLELLKIYVPDGEKLSIYNILGNSDLYLCGTRDLSGLFACEKKEENRKAKIWEQYLGEEEQNAYRLARTDYYMETERKDKLTEEEWKLFDERRRKEPWQAFLFRNLSSAQKEETEKLAKWLRHSDMSKTMDVTEENYMLLFYQAKGYILLYQYEKAKKDSYPFNSVLICV